MELVEVKLRGMRSLSRFKIPEMAPRLRQQSSLRGRQADAWSWVAMKFVDEALITIQSGDGGNGCASFRREKYTPKGGPDGGDGGRGGHVVFETTSRINTLYRFNLKKHFKAQRGAHGRGKNQSGKNGKDLVIEVPPGTLIRDAESGRIMTVSYTHLTLPTN